VNDLAPGLGHNQPPVDPLDSDALLARLQDEHRDLLTRFVELRQGAARFPKELTSEDQATRAVEFIAQCRTLAGSNGAAEKAHKAEKAPYLACSRIVDIFFLGRIKEFNDTVIAPLSAVLARYHEKKRREQQQREAEQRRRAEEERRQAEAEAARLAAEAARAAQTDNRRAAIELGAQADEAAGRAQQAQAIVEAPSAPTRIHGDYGATAYAQERWFFEVTDPTLIPLGYLRTNDEVINQAINKGGVRDIPGLRIWREDRLVVRKC
jgi:hypothetical protein